MPILDREKSKNIFSYVADLSNTVAEAFLFPTNRTPRMRTKQLPRYSVVELLYSPEPLPPLKKRHHSASKKKGQSDVLPAPPKSGRIKKCCVREIKVVRFDAHALSEF